MMGHAGERGWHEAAQPLCRDGGGILARCSGPKTPAEVMAALNISGDDAATLTAQIADKRRAFPPCCCTAGGAASSGRSGWRAWTRPGRRP